MKQLLDKLLSLDYIRFGLVGALGFIVNLILLMLLYKLLHVPLFIAQLVSAEVALFSNFMLHHHWTYRHNGVIKSPRRLILEFHVTSWVAIIGTAAIVSLTVESLHLQYLIALCIAGALAMVWNYLWSKFVVWKKSPTPELDK